MFRWNELSHVVPTRHGFKYFKTFDESTALPTVLEGPSLGHDVRGNPSGGKDRERILGILAREDIPMSKPVAPRPIPPGDVRNKPTGRLRPAYSGLRASTGLHYGWPGTSRIACPGKGKEGNGRQGIPHPPFAVLPDRIRLIREWRPDKGRTGTVSPGLSNRGKGPIGSDHPGD